MQRERPLALFLMGCCCCSFAAIWFVWLFLANIGDFLNLLAVALGNEALLEELARHGLNSAGPIRFTSAILAMQAALVGVLACTGYGLLRLQRWGRWCGIAFSIFAIVVAICSTVGRLIWLTGPGEGVRVSPLVLDGISILFANVLLGTMVLPEVTAAYAGDMEPAVVDNAVPGPTADPR